MIEAYLGLTPARWQSIRRVAATLQHSRALTIREFKPDKFKM
jgi:hypothetical protein